VDQRGSLSSSIGKKMRSMWVSNALSILVLEREEEEGGSAINAL